MKEIPLSGKKAAGRVVRIDDGDYELVMQYQWHIWECRRADRIIGPYAKVGVMRNGVQRNLFMHALITGWPETDHRDHNGLNNQRSNLREVTHRQNMYGQLPQVGCLSQYRGVTLVPGRKKWRARITVDGKVRCLGRYASEEDAAKAYDAAALAEWGEFAYLNLGRPEAA